MGNQICSAATPDLLRILYLAGSLSIKLEASIQDLPKTFTTLTSVNMVSRVINLGLRGLQFLWTLLVMALVGNMIATAFSGNPSSVNYTIFVSVFSMLSLFYLIPTALKPDFSFHPLLAVVLDLLNTLFFFCAAVALAAFLGVHSCSNDSYTRSNHITNGSVDSEKRCREAQASTAFLFFGFAAYLASLFFSIMESRGTNVNMRGIRRGPAMSQV